MKGRSLFHPEVPRQTPLREEICRELNRAAETSANHGRTNTPVQSAHTFRAVDLSQSVICVAVPMLCPNGEERRVRLEPCLYQEEWRPKCCADDTRARSGEYVDPEGLYVWILKDGRSGSPAHRFVQAQTTSVEKKLVDILQPRQPTVTKHRTLHIQQYQSLAKVRAAPRSAE